MPEEKMYRDLSLHDKVTVEIPVHDIIRAQGEYCSTEWEGSSTSTILYACLQAILEPRFVKEREAAMQAARDQQEAMARKMLHIPEDGLNLRGFFGQSEEGPDPE